MDFSHQEQNGGTNFTNSCMIATHTMARKAWYKARVVVKPKNQHELRWGWSMCSSIDTIRGPKSNTIRECLHDCLKRRWSLILTSYNGSQSKALEQEYSWTWTAIATGCENFQYDPKVKSARGVGNDHNKNYMCVFDEPSYTQIWGLRLNVLLFEFTPSVL